MGVAWPKKMATGIKYCQNGHLAKAKVTLDRASIKKDIKLLSYAKMHSAEGFEHAGALVLTVQNLTYGMVCNWNVFDKYNECTDLTSFIQPQITDY